MIYLTYTRTNALTAHALKLLGEQITHRHFQNESASYRLSEYIEKLRDRHGWPVITKEETSQTTNPVSRAATFERYLIEPKFFWGLRNEQGEKLDTFIKFVQEFEHSDGSVKNRASCSSDKTHVSV